MAYDFHLSTMMPLSFTFKETWKQSHVSHGKLRARAKARSTLKRARDGAERGGAVADVAAAREAARGELLAALSAGATASASSSSAAVTAAGASAGRASAGATAACRALDGAAAAELRAELISASGDAARLLRLLQSLSDASVDESVLRRTSIGRTVNSLAKSHVGDHRDDVAVRQLARQLVARWKQAVGARRCGREAARSAAEALERALWADLATDVDVEDRDEAYAERVAQLRRALSVNDALRQRALAGAPADEVVEEALEMEASDEDESDDSDS
eukprot:TRINITY_DN52305_c0_g1_i1.p1 TRINITY_DN52305_c0_g1~~TRINITY_DN52305_c0_g1_i1.p1  ORF type:complete len:277 (+),score=84.94 TRINITY_DN52305_c0_g1_i1:85-915(+)